MSTSRSSIASTRDTPIEETVEALSRRGQGRQGALSRRLLDVGLAVHEDAGPAARQRPRPVRLDAELRQSGLPRGGARDAALVPGRGHRGDAVEPARARLPRRQQAARRVPPPSARAPTATRTRWAWVPSRTMRSSSGSQTVAERLGVKPAQVALAWVWACPASPRRSSAPPSRTTCRTRWRRSS